MARLPRYILPGQPQHVIQRGNNRSPMFRTASDYLFFRDRLQTACQARHCQIHAYVLMPNHVHLLVTPRHRNGIAKVMQSVGGRFTKHVNAAYQRTGTLYEGRYRATLIDSERYLLTCYRYIELNPVRAGLVLDPAHYPWSSHRCNALGGEDPLVTPHERYRALGANSQGRQAAYRTLFRRSLDDSALRELRLATHTGWVLGGNAFRDAVAPLVARRCQPSPRGGNRVGSGRPQFIGV